MMRVSNLWGPRGEGEMAEPPPGATNLGRMLELGAGRGDEECKKGPGEGRRRDLIV